MTSQKSCDTTGHVWEEEENNYRCLLSNLFISTAMLATTPASGPHLPFPQVPLHLSANPPVHFPPLRLPSFKLSYKKLQLSPILAMRMPQPPQRPPAQQFPNFFSHTRERERELGVGVQTSKHMQHSEIMVQSSQSISAPVHYI